MSIKSFVDARCLPHTHETFCLSEDRARESVRRETVLKPNFDHDANAIPPQLSEQGLAARDVPVAAPSLALGARPIGSDLRQFRLGGFMRDEWPSGTTHRTAGLATARTGFSVGISTGSSRSARLPARAGRHEPKPLLRMHSASASRRDGDAKTMLDRREWRRVMVGRGAESSVEARAFDEHGESANRQPVAGCVDRDDRSQRVRIDRWPRAGRLP